MVRKGKPRHGAAWKLLSPRGMALGSDKPLAPGSASVPSHHCDPCAPVQRGARGSERDFRACDVREGEERLAVLGTRRADLLRAALHGLPGDRPREGRGGGTRAKRSST